MDYVKTLTDLVTPLVEDKDSLEVREMPSLEDKKVFYVYAKHNDISKLIGRKGIMANSIRRMMSVAGRMNEEQLEIKFESYGEE